MIDLWEKAQPQTMRLIRYARERLGVQVHFIDHETALNWCRDSAMPRGVSKWPMPRYAFCSMGSMGSKERGQVWLDETLIDACPTETTLLTASDPVYKYPDKVFLFSAIAHEIAHAVVGKDEEYATEYERALARTVQVPAHLARNLNLYAPSDPLPSHRRDLIAQGFLFRPAPRKLPQVRTVRDVPDFRT